MLAHWTPHSASCVIGIERSGQRSAWNSGAVSVNQNTHIWAQFDPNNLGWSAQHLQIIAQT